MKVATAKNVNYVFYFFFGYTIQSEKGDAPYLLNLDDISSITAFGGETCFWHRDGDSSVYDDSFDTVRLMIGAAQGGIPMDTGGSY